MRHLSLALLLTPLAAAAVAQAPRNPIPAELTMPGDQPAIVLPATGVQIYKCVASAGGKSPEWVFQEPRAELFLAGRRVGRHYAGPTWEHEDGSIVTGKVEARAKAPESNADIPWLRLGVSGRRGDGAFSDVTAIQRINTRGGTLEGSCPEIGRVSEVPYTSDYVMLRRRS